MTEDERQKLTAALHERAESAAKTANSAAKAASGWRRWVYAAVAIIAGAVAFFTATSCTVSYKQSACGGIEFSSAIVTQK
jgi:hypothetical protein